MTNMRQISVEHKIVIITRAMIINNNYKTNLVNTNSKYKVFISQPNILQLEEFSKDNQY